jgi:CCR4-NOT complex subunit CAF16
MTTDIELTNEETLAIDCQGLTYAFAEGLESALDGVDLQLKKGDRCLLVGANGGQSCSRFDIWHGPQVKFELIISR